MQCLNHDHPLQAALFNHRHVFQCSLCSGVLLLRTSLWSKHGDAALNAALQTQLINSPETDQACPKCTQPLRSLTLKNPTDSKVDEQTVLACAVCKSTWLTGEQAPVILSTNRNPALAAVVAGAVGAVLASQVV